MGTETVTSAVTRASVTEPRRDRAISVAERRRAALTGERVEGRERDGQPAEHDVGHGQVDDEYVGDGAHVFVGPDHVDDEHVAEHAQREY